jgi:hypothetical protein
MQKARSPKRPITAIAPTMPPTMGPVLDEVVEALTGAGTVVYVDTSLVRVTVDPIAFVELVGAGQRVQEIG